jgi:pilus assembly protein CpaB
MNSTFLRILAALMVIAAIVTGYLGFRISNKQPADTLKVVVPTYSHVLATNDIAAGHVLTAEDLKLTTTQQHDKQTFNDPQHLIGKATTSAVMKDAPFKTTHFPAKNVFGLGLAADERAIAIKVNEVIGVGGFIKPGDHVDVLLYLHKDQETGQVSSSQVVLNNVKVLAYGTLTAEAEASPQEEVTQATPNKLGLSNSRMDSKSARDSRSAILAVHAQDTAKLMLADSTGILRLALRGESSPSTGTTATTNNQFVRLAEVSQSPGIAPAPTVNTAVTPDKASVKPHTPTTKRERIIVHRGEQIEVVNVKK